MDFEDNNPLGLGGEELPRRRAQSPPEPLQSTALSQQQRVVISEAGKSHEGSSRGHITYTIRIAPGKTVRRRYSEFESLRKLLRRLFPCVVVPPIPEKHSLGAYASNPAHAHEDARVIEHRQRTLANFLNRCVAIPQIKGSWILERFLDPNTSWRELMQSDFVLKLPASPLQAPPIDPASATPAHVFLPIPTGSVSLSRTVSPEPSKVKNSKNQKTPKISKTTPNSTNLLGNESLDETSDDRASNGLTDDGSHTDSYQSPSASFAASEHAAREYERVIGGGLEKRARKINKHYSLLAAEYADLGGQFNSFSLDSHGQFDKFAPAVEKVGQAVDQGYISTTHLVDRLSVEFSEPLAESVQMAATARQILKYRRQRELQVQIIKDALTRQTKQLADLRKAESEAQRMNAYLHADDRILAATEGLGIQPEMQEDTDRDHVVDQDGIHDRDHEITRDQYRRHNSDSNASDDEDHIHDTTSINSSFLDAEAETLIPTRTTESGTTAAAPATGPVTGPESSAGAASSNQPTTSTNHKNGTSLRRGFKLPGLSHINHAIHGIMDVDPQTSRRNNITRLQERIQQLRAALEVAEQDAETSATEVSAEIARYNEAKHGDIRQFVKSFVRCHIEWAEKNLESWIEAKQAIANS